MSSDAASAPTAPHARTIDASRQGALRLAFGVTASFAAVEALDWDVTFLAPLLAANMLVKLQRSPTVAQGLGLIVLIGLSTGTVLLITSALITRPGPLILAVALVLYLAFYAHRRGAPDLATLLLQISAVALPTIAVLSPDGMVAFATTLLLAGCVALVVVWVAHLVFPAPIGSDAAPATGPAPGAEPATAARHALHDTLVILPLLAWFILDATEVAVVVLIVIVTLLRQVDPAKGQRAALALIFGNLIGGIAAAVVYNLVLLDGSLAFFIVACLAASLLFAGSIATAGERAPVYAIALSTFILLLGLGISPMPGGSGEAFVSRIVNVLVASAYAIGVLSLRTSGRQTTPVY